MTTNDKTGEKLLASMRKTKAAAAGKSSATEDAKQPSQKKRPQSQGKKKPTPPPAQKDAGVRAVDPYQRGRRVWPD